jgi:hypothetical protein
MLIEQYDDPRAKVTLGMLLANSGDRNAARMVWREAAHQGDRRAMAMLDRKSEP